MTFVTRKAGCEPDDLPIVFVGDTCIGGLEALVAADVSGALAKAASGALELVSLAPIQNLARGISELRKAGVIVIGLDGASDRLLDEELLSPDLRGRAVALVLGAEGKGLRQLTAESCDRLCRIGGDGTIASLNVSNAAAVALHLAAMARRRG